MHIQAASKFGVYPNIQFNKKVVSSIWNTKTSKWDILISDGTSISANVVVSCVGGLHVPNTPEFEGKVIKSAENIKL